MPNFRQKGGDEVERQLRLSMEEFEHLLENADLIDGGEAINQVHIEPGELVITIVQ